MNGVALTARAQVFVDSLLSCGARNLFGLIWDLSFDPRFTKRRGQVAISNTVLRSKLGCSKAAICKWTRELRDRGYLRVSKLRVPNMWGVNVFHVTARRSKRGEAT